VSLAAMPTLAVLLHTVLPIDDFVAEEAAAPQRLVSSFFDDVWGMIRRKQTNILL
jgi:hypothetical protein